MPARIAAFVVWAAVAACAAFWGLRLFVSPRGVPAQAQPVSVASAQRADILRLFASAAEPATPAAEPALAARFKLIGVMAPRNAQQGREQGVALISVDDKPPRAYRVGARVDNTLVLQSVAARSAVIGPPRGAAAVQLDLPLPVAPATGTLPRADGFSPVTPSVLPSAANPAQPGALAAQPPSFVPPPELPPSAVPAAPATTPESDPAFRR